MTRALAPFLIALFAFTASCEFERTESEIIDEAGKSLEECVDALEGIKDSETAKAARERVGRAVDELDELVKEVREGEYDAEALKKAYEERLAPKIGDLTQRGGEAVKNLVKTFISNPEILGTGILEQLGELWDRAGDAIEKLGGK